MAVHPFLLALFPILLLYSKNSHQFYLEVTFWPMFITLLTTLLVTALLALILKNWNRAGLLVSLFLLMFSSYGHLVHGFKTLFGADSFSGRYLLFAWVPAFAVCAFIIIRTRRELRAFTTILNLSAAVLVLFPLVTIAASWWTEPASFLDRGEENSEPAIDSPADHFPYRPNIYYIILDGYARQDVLSEIYKFDNSHFLATLKDRGFYVAEASRSNYIQTALSLASSLNTNYVEALLPHHLRRGENRGPLIGLIQNNRFYAALRILGYRIVAFASGYYATELEHSDLYITPSWMLSEFEAGLVRATPIPTILELLKGSSTEFDMHRERILYTLEHLEDTCSLKGPLLVVAHIVCPHPPFVFDSDGQPVQPKGDYEQSDGTHFFRTGHSTPQEYANSYLDQLVFLNRKLPGTLDALLSKSQIEPIIILQADHGPGLMLNWTDPTKTNLMERLSILNAYYLPRGGDRHLYPGITPVNTFRVILNHYFRQRLPLLQDESFYSTWHDPYTFINVTEQVRVGSQTGSTLFDVWGANGTVWIAGVKGSIGYWDGKTWSRLPSMTGETLLGIGGNSPEQVWVVGTNGTVIRLEGKEPRIVDSGTTYDLHGVWCASPNNVWVVGRAGAIMRWDGKAFQNIDSGTNRDLYQVWGLSPNAIWVVGQSGTVLHWDGKDLEKVDTGTDQDLLGIWGSSENDVWVVGRKGTILHWDGKAFSQRESGTSRTLYDIWGSAANDVWTVGEQGTTLHWNASNWSTTPSPTSRDLHGIWGSGSKGIWSVGEAGVLMYR